MYCIESKYEIEKRQQRPVVILWILIKVDYTNKRLVKNNGLSFKIWNHNINKQILEIQVKKATKSPNLLCKHHMGDFVKLLWLSWKTLENGILLPKLLRPTVRKIVPVIEKNFWNSRLKAEICKSFEITRTICSISERSEQFLVAECFFNLCLEVSHT